MKEKVKDKNIEPLLLKTTQVLKILNISRATLKKLQKEKAFPKPLYLVADRPVWEKNSVLAWIELLKR